MKACAVDVCGRAARSRGYCNRHYENQRRYGDPVPQRDRPLQERLREIGWTITPTGCWEWKGPRNEHGYGLFFARRLGFEGTRAHRVMYEYAVGPIPEGRQIRHRCDNPPCVNPDHLEPGTAADNSADMVSRRRHWMHGRSECVNGHDLTLPDATRVIAHGGRTETICVRCDRARKQRYAERMRATA